MLSVRNRIAASIALPAPTIPPHTTGMKEPGTACCDSGPGGGTAPRPPRSSSAASALRDGPGAGALLQGPFDLLAQDALDVGAHRLCRPRWHRRVCDGSAPSVECRQCPVDGEPRLPELTYGEIRPSFPHAADNSSAAADARRRWATASDIARPPTPKGTPAASCGSVAFAGPWGRRRPQACNTDVIKLNQTLRWTPRTARVMASTQRLSWWRTRDPWNPAKLIQPVGQAETVSVAGRVPPCSENQLAQLTVFNW